MLSDIVKRNGLFRKRKETVLKKAHQLAALSGADVMVFLRYGSQTIAYNENHGEAWPTLEQADRSGYLLDASFRSLSPSRAGGHRGRHPTSSTEGSTISNNQDSLRSRMLPPLDGRIRTNDLPDADSRQRNSVPDHPQFYANPYTNLAQLPALTNHDDPFLRRCNNSQPGTSSNPTGLRIRTDVDPDAGLMQGQEAVSWDNLHSGDAHPPTIVSNDATIRTVPDTNRNAGLAYSRKAIEHDAVVLHDCVSTISDPGIALAGTVEGAVAWPQDMDSIYKSQCKSPSREDVNSARKPVMQQSIDSRPSRCYGHPSRNTQSSKLSNEGRSKLIEGFSQLWPLDDDLPDDSTQRWTPIPEMDLTKTAYPTHSNHSLLFAENQKHLHHACKAASGDAYQQEEPDGSKTTKPTLRELLCMPTYTVDKTGEPLAMDEQSTDNGRSTQTHRHHQGRDEQSLQANIGISRDVGQTSTTSDTNGDGQDVQSQCYRQTRSQTKRIAEANAKRAAKRLRT